MPLKLMLSGLEFSLDQVRLRVGRADHLDVSIHGDPLISSNHCIVDGGVLVDAASTNGTSVNGQKIKHDHRVPLKHGDVVTLGETALYVVEGVPYDGVGPTTADGRPIEISTKGGTGKQPKKKETAGASKAPSSSARVKHKAGHERDGSSAAASAASSAAPSPASSTTYRPAPTAPASPTSLPGSSPTASSAFNFTDQSRPLPSGPFSASTAASHTATASRSSSHAASRAEPDRSRLLDISQASLDDSMSAEGLLDLGAPAGRGAAEGVVEDVDDSAMELEEDSINISMDSTAARALDPTYRINALNNSLADNAPHPTFPPPPYQLPSPSASSASLLSQSGHSLDTTRLADDGGDSPRSQQVRKLQDALRESEVRAGRLERKLSHTQRRVSGAQVDATNRQAARVAELEGQVASLSYQLLYGAGPKDQEIQRLCDELNKARVESDLHKYAAVESQRNGAVKEERRTAEEAAARAQQEKAALAAITEASTLLGKTRTELMAAVSEYGTGMKALLAVQQTLAAQQQLLEKSSRMASKEPEGTSHKTEQSYEQLLSAVNGAAHSTATALAAERTAREEREAEWSRELSSVAAQLAAVNQLVCALHDKVAVAKEEQQQQQQQQQVEGGTAETSEVRQRAGRKAEESKQTEGDIAHTTAAALAKQSPPGTATALPPHSHSHSPSAATEGSPSTAALQSDVSGLKGQVSRMSAQLQQVWMMVAGLLALTALLLALRR